MTRFPKLRVGDLVRVTTLYVQGAAYVHGVIWAVVLGDITHERAQIAVFFGPKESWGEDELDYGDTFERVSEKRVPNYASAALAKWRLTGEKAEVRTS